MWCSFENHRKYTSISKTRLCAHACVDTCILTRALHFLFFFVHRRPNPCSMWCSCENHRNHTSMHFCDVAKNAPSEHIDICHPYTSGSEKPSKRLVVFLEPGPGGKGGRGGSRPAGHPVLRLRRQALVESRSRRRQQKEEKEEQGGGSSPDLPQTLLRRCSP